MDRAARVRELRGKYPDIRPFVDEVQEARLAALREVREMVLIRTGWIVEAIDDLIKREEER